MDVRATTKQRMGPRSLCGREIHQYLQRTHEKEKRNMIVKNTIIFVVRVHKLDAGRLGFYIPKNVIEFYQLTGRESVLENSIIKWRTKTGQRLENLPNLGTKLYPHSSGIRGVIPRWSSMSEPSTLVEFVLELTLYLV